MFRGVKVRLKTGYRLEGVGKATRGSHVLVAHIVNGTAEPKEEARLELTQPDGRYVDVDLGTVEPFSSRWVVCEGLSSLAEVRQGVLRLGAVGRRLSPAECGCPTFFRALVSELCPVAVLAADALVERSLSKSRKPSRSLRRLGAAFAAAIY